MKARLPGVALLLLVTLTACTSPAQQAPKPPGSPVSEAPKPDPNPAMPKVRNPQLQPTVLGIAREALGPGLVIQGRTSAPEIQVELVRRSALLKAQIVQPKDGAFNLAWDAPREPGTTVVVTEKGKPGKPLIQGDVGNEEKVGLFYSTSFSGTRVDVTDMQKMAIKVSGQVRAPEGRFWVEYRNEGGVLEVQAVQASRAAPEAGTFAFERELPRGAHRLHFYLLNGDGSVDVDLIVPVVTR